MKSTILTTNLQPVSADVLLLGFRILTGIVFIMFGYPKIQTPFTWMGADSAWPAFFQLLGAIAEFIGGMALILGFLTRIAAAGIAFTMIIAAYYVKYVYKMPFLNMENGMGYFINLLWMLVALWLMIMGPGRFSIDRLLFGVTIRKPIAI